MDKKLTVRQPWLCIYLHQLDVRRTLEHPRRAAFQLHAPLKLPIRSECHQQCQGEELQEKRGTPSPPANAGYCLQHLFTRTAGPPYSYSFLKTEVSKPKHERPPADIPYVLP